jgi:sugar lactone lactonase YvrE
LQIENFSRRTVAAIALLTAGAVSLFATLPTGSRNAVQVIGKLPTLPPNSRPHPGQGQSRLDSAFRHNEPNQADSASLSSANPGQTAATGGLASAADPNSSKFYVADTGNNRVLGWLNITAALNGQPADLIIGQNDAGVVQINSGYNVPGITQPWCDDTSLSAPAGVAVDSLGNLWVSDTLNNRILRFPAPFAQTTRRRQADLAIGHSSAYLCQPNQGLGAPDYNTLAQPRGIAIYKSTTGNAVEWLYVTDSLNNRVLSYDLSRPTATLGNASGVWGQPGWTTGSPNCGSGTPSATCLRLPTEIAVGPTGSLYVSDNQNNRALRFPATDPTHLPSTTANAVWGQTSFTVNSCLSAPTAATLCFPRGIALFNGQVVIADNGNNRILQYPLPPPDNVTAVSVIGQADFVSKRCNAFGTGAKSVCAPGSLTVAGSPAKLWVADLSNHRMLRFDTVATGASASLELGQNDFLSRAANGKGADFGLYSPNAVVVDDRALPYHLYVSDELNNRVLGYRDYVNRQLNLPPDLVIGQADLFSVAPNRGATGAGPGYLSLPAANSLSDPGALAVDASGNLYVADQANNRVLRFPDPFNNPAQTADLVLGQPDFVSALPNHGLAGGAIDARGLHNPAGVAADGTGLWVSDQINSRIVHYPVLSNYAAATEVIGQATLTSGTCQTPATTTLCFPTQMTLQNQTAGSGTGTITTMTTSTTVNGTGTSFTTQAAVGGTISSGGVLLGTVASITSNTVLVLNANALAQVTGANFTYVNTARKLWAVDGGNSRTLMYNLAGGSPLVATLCLGEGDCITRAGGTATVLQLFPSAVGVNPAGDVFVADTGNNRACGYPVPASSGAGCTLLIGQTSYTTQNPNGSGLNRGASNQPKGIAVDKDGRVIVADTDNNRVGVYIP